MTEEGLTLDPIPLLDNGDDALSGINRKINHILSALYFIERKLVIME